MCIRKATERSYTHAKDPVACVRVRWIMDTPILTRHACTKSVGVGAEHYREDPHCTVMIASMSLFATGYFGSWVIKHIIANTIRPF